MEHLTGLAGTGRVNFACFTIHFACQAQPAQIAGETLECMLCMATYQATYVCLLSIGSQTVLTTQAEMRYISAAE